MGKEIYSTFEVAKICNMDMSTVISWIDKGILNAFKTPGGHRRVNKNDLITFLKKYQMPIPDKFDSKIKILIVDDENDMLELLNLAVKKLDEEVELYIAKDGFTAGKIIGEKKPDLLIIDLFLPEVDGFEIIKNVRKDIALKNMKIIVITAFDSYENRIKIKKTDIDLYLTKPFVVNDLKDRINKILFQ